MKKNTKVVRYRFIIIITIIFLLILKFLVISALISEAIISITYNIILEKIHKNEYLQF